MAHLKERGQNLCDLMLKMLKHDDDLAYALMQALLIENDIGCHGCDISGLRAKNDQGAKTSGHS